MVPSRYSLLFLLSLVSLLSSGIFAERGNAVPAQSPRSLAVNRPTDKPVDQPTSHDGDDDDENAGKGGNGESSGKGGSTVEDDDEDTAGKGDSGKGTTGKGGSSTGDDDDSDDYNTGKGTNTGKGATSSSSTDGKGTASPSSTHGKGAVSSKSSKSSKSAKSKKSGKSSKGKGKGNGGGDGGGGGNSTDTRACTFPDDEENTIEVRSMPFEIHYFPADTTPNTQDYDGLADVTDEYLEAFMRQEFDRTSLTNLNAFVTCLGRNEFESGNRIRVGYRSYGFFDNDSIFLPTVRELDQLVRDAFEGDNREEYIRVLRRDLPDDNPFGDTEDIEFNEAQEGWNDDRWDNTNEGENSSQSSSTGGSFVRAGVAAGAAGVVVLAAGLAIMRSRSRHDGFDAEDDTFPPHKNLSEEVTVAGETCNMSVDGSTMAQSWKSPRGFQTSTSEDEGEFQDEPLDDSK